MLIRLLHKLASQPVVYDWIQRLAGVDQIYARVAPHLRVSAARPTILDVGGGTGTMRRFFPADSQYICMDIEMPKLRGFRTKSRDGLAVLCDATKMSFRDGFADALICTSVAHHLTDDMLEVVLRESVRVLKPGGQLFFLDPIADPNRPIGRMIWKLDRGSHPRAADTLRNALDRSFNVVRWEQFAVYHAYVFAIGVRT